MLREGTAATFRRGRRPPTGSGWSRRHPAASTAATRPSLHHRCDRPATTPSRATGGRGSRFRADVAGCRALGWATGAHPPRAAAWKAHSGGSRADAVIGAEGGASAARAAEPAAAVTANADVPHAPWRTRVGRVPPGVQRRTGAAPCSDGAGRRRTTAMAKNTKAAVLNVTNEPLTVETLTLREPREGDVVVRLGASGVCHSDLHAITGDLPMPIPCVLGHEGAGVVEAVGPGVQRVKVGDHVVLNWVPFCGACWYCRSGNNYLCQDGYVKAMAAEVFHKNGTTVGQFAGIGSMSEYTIVPETACIPIDADIPLDRACLIGCGVMTGVGAVINTARVRPGQSVAVFGAGGVGLNVVQGAVLAGADPIIAIDLNERKLGMAKQFGATHV